VGWFAGIPIRLRLTLVFALVMAIVLTGLGLFLYLRLDAALDEALDHSLRSRADDIAALVSSGRFGLDEGASRLAEHDESFAQVLSTDGEVLDSTPELGEARLLTEEELQRAKRATIVVERTDLPGAEEPVRLLATPVDAQGGRLVVVVGASTEQRADALESLVTQLAIIGPIALLLVSLAAYGLAAAALRPVESMRRDAEAVSASEPGRKLTVPPARDEIRRLAETLNEMLASLEAALARERRFVADASHELRTPLATLRAELELALRRERTIDELETTIRSAADESERLSALADDLLVLARADAGLLHARRERVDVEGLLETVRARYARRAARAGRSIAVDGTGNGWLEGDRVRLEQALGNLVDNALRHGAGDVLLKADGARGCVRLHVLDEGAGFADDFVDSAFDAFTQEDQARSSKGAGLGLAIADAVARAHGGKAEIANLDGGVDVWLELPTTRLDDDP
jgi:heavy metal sensor kinase